MFKQLINRSNGAFTINNDFIVSNKTILNDLQLHFEKDQLVQSTHVSNCYYTSSQFEINNLFFKFIFYFENERVKRIGFEIETVAKPRNNWANNLNIETNWIASQMNNTDSFSWENKSECNQYISDYIWGEVGVFYDFKNGTYNSYLAYKINQ